MKKFKIDKIHHASNTCKICGKKFEKEDKTKEVFNKDFEEFFIVCEHHKDLS